MATNTEGAGVERALAIDAFDASIGARFALSTGFWVDNPATMMLYRVVHGLLDLCDSLWAVWCPVIICRQR
jgi:hypothetical protein